MIAVHDSQYMQISGRWPVALVYYQTTVSLCLFFDTQMCMLMVYTNEFIRAIWQNE
jgi:hypothetical protein